MKLKLITPLLLIVSTLFFMANANAETIKTNISGLVIKDLHCSSFTNTYSGRWVNRNNQSLGTKKIHINMYDSDGDSMGVQSTYSIDMGAKTGGDFVIIRGINNIADCNNARSFDISVTKL